MESSVFNVKEQKKNRNVASIYYPFAFEKENVPNAIIKMQYNSWQIL